MHHKHTFRLEREARRLHQLMPGNAEYGGYEDLGGEYEPEGLSYDAYDALPYEGQLNYMQQPQWMNSTLDWQSQLHVQQMQQSPWYAQSLEGGMPFDAMTQGHYMPYAYLYHGANAWQGHPAWNPQMYGIPESPYGEPPFPEPTPRRDRIVVEPRMRHTTLPTTRPTVPERPAFGGTSWRRPPSVESPVDRTPSHPLDRSGRLAAAYAPYFNSSDPTVRATAQRWWDQAVRILENHPNDSVIFGQLVRGASDNLGRATRQHSGVAETRREWEERMPSPQHSMRVTNNPGDQAAAIVITRNGDFSDRILYYPNKSSPFWDMRSMERAREWGIVFESDTYSTGRYPSSVNVKFYGPGNFSVGGVGGVRVPQSSVVIGAEAQARQSELAEQENQTPLQQMELSFNGHEPRAIEVRRTGARDVMRILPGARMQYREGIGLEEASPGEFILRFYQAGTYTVSLIEQSGGSIRQATVTVAPRREPPRRLDA